MPASASQLVPNARGVPGSASRLVANTTAATTPSTATTAATPPVRVDALRSPPLGSRVIAIPTVTGGDRPAAIARRASADGRCRSLGAPAVRATTRCAAHTPRPTVTSTTATNPPTRTTPSRLRPGFGSARRAVPSGKSGDSANAPSTDNAAPINATGTAASPTVTTRIRRDSAEGLEEREVAPKPVGDAAEHDRGDDQAGEPGDDREHDQAGGEHVDRLLDPAFELRRRLHLELARCHAVRPGVPAEELDDSRCRRGVRQPHEEHHRCERPDLTAVALEKRRRREEEPTGVALDRQVARDPGDADHAESDFGPLGPGRLAATAHQRRDLSRRVPGDDEMVADSDVHRVREGLGDGHLVGPVGMRSPSVEQPSAPRRSDPGDRRRRHRTPGTSH